MNSTARTRIPPRTHFPQGDHRREGHALQVTRRPDIQAVERLPRKKGHRYGAPGRNTETNLTKQRHVLCQQADRDIMCLFLGLVPKQTTNGRHKRGTTTRQERLVSDLCRSCRRRDTCSFVSFVGRCSPRRMQFEASCRNETATVAARRRQVEILRRVNSTWSVRIHRFLDRGVRA